MISLAFCAPKRYHIHATLDFPHDLRKAISSITGIKAIQCTTVGVIVNTLGPLGIPKSQNDQAHIGVSQSAKSASTLSTPR